MSRCDGRAVDEIRPTSFQLDFQANALASVLVCAGKTRVICSVSDVRQVPRWMKEQKVPGGWMTSEYRMLPAAGDRRKPRDSGRPDGRSTEIQRLIGRSLRAVVDLEKIGGRTLYVDCDVLDADGGTRCASITGATVALQLAMNRLFAKGDIKTLPIKEPLAAVSVGILNGEPLLDICYEEDSAAEVDMNVVMTASGKFIEIQGTAESEPFTRQEMDAMLDLARKGIEEILELQKQALA
jgi:ribonuclease PH